MGPALHRQCEARWQNPLSARRASCPFRRLNRLPVSLTYALLSSMMILSNHPEEYEPGSRDASCRKEEQGRPQKGYEAGMPTPILATKLYVPPLRPEMVSRPRLLGQLNEGLHRKLILISAPAGFGKTTLISEWLAACERPAAWLSLDAGDSDPIRFLTYLVAALQTIAPHIGDEVPGLLQSSQPPPPEVVLTALLNDLATIQDQFVLVLDDYHVLEVKAVDQTLTFLLEHLPPHMHLVIATREDPGLPLARFRARDQMIDRKSTRLNSSHANISYAVFCLKK